MFTYQCKGTCSTSINLEIQDGIITYCKINNGCTGNTQGVARLVEGMPVEEAIRRLKGIRCGFKSTSCPDQLALALEAVLAQ
jgi:uncharacterized protein (TIGR03905 family)